MIDGRSDDRQTDRNVNGRFEIEEFHWGVTLVVIHTYHRVIAILMNRLMENRISWVGPGRINPTLYCLVNRGSDVLLFFIPKKPIFAGVRIKSADGNAWNLGIR